MTVIRAGGITLTTLGRLAGFRNLLINPYGFFNQRAATSIADDAYGHDRWYALTQTGAITVSTLSDVEDGTPRMMRLNQDQASAQRMGYAQIIEAQNCKWLRGQDVVLSGRVRLSASANLRYAILEWTSTEDSVTSDVVNNWTSAAYTAGNFFLASNLTVRAVGSIALTANTLTDLTELTATLGSSFNNLIVFVWTEGTAAQNVTLDLALQLEKGSTATAREVRPYGVELVLCQRYCEILGSTTGNEIYGAGQVASTTRALGFYGFQTQKRSAPTVTLSSASHWAFFNQNVLAFVTWVTVSPQLSAYGVLFDVSGMAASLGGAGDCALWGPKNTASAKMTFVAEL